MLAVSIEQKDIPIIERMANCLRFLSADMVQKAGSGHPGAPMGLAEIMSVLSLHLRLTPSNPQWLNRDRIVFSGGHTSAMIYSLLHLWGFNVPLEALQNFRQLESITPGHPEYGLTEGIEITTGPLGQGVANAVGFAMAARYAQERLGSDIINHQVYCICGDGDLQEGISYEACSLAGHLQLSSLVMIYDCNRITIEGDVGLAFSEDVRTRFVAQGWEVFECDGHNAISINEAINGAKQSPKPALVIAHTIIAKGAKNLSGSHKTHGAPLGEEEIATSKVASGFCNADDTFYVPDDVRFYFRMLENMGSMLELQWNLRILALSEEKKALLQKLLVVDTTDVVYPTFETGSSIATRASNGQILQAIAAALPGFLGGSADLSPSNNTYLQKEQDFPQGRNLHFGIREHSSAAITNAIAAYGLFLPFCATFFVFSDYLAPSVRLAALMKLRCFYIWTHDSIGVGEDGATHQPIEQLSHLRAMPGLYVFRPADANENVAAWQVALELQAPSAFVLSRQNLPVLQPCTQANIAHGGYILQSSSEIQLVLMASGSEVSLCLAVAQILESQNIGVQVVSVPCFDLLLEQNAEYQNLLFPSNTLRIAIEAARAFEWYRFADHVISMHSFGHSAPGEQLFKYFGFDAETIAGQILERLQNS